MTCRDVHPTKERIAPSPALVQYLSHLEESTARPETLEAPYENESINCMVLRAASNHEDRRALARLAGSAEGCGGGCQMGTDLLREMLNYPAVLATGSGQKRARLGKPMLVFDKVGVAIGFVPTGEDQYTYHHLRTDLYGMALRSGVKMDTCYIACTAHITLDRFVSTTTFDSDSDEGTQKHIENWIRTIQCINQEVKDRCNR
ncbi:hypothetical protein CPC735_064310 [Coccidioides posadasii C735 delta SOWgp]|uniref:Uncharacterized protein n=1 Tax=Coccidioides posadasii (strain C735) TaxID=222929 RepID=C5P4E0_COCP7|nr:hypothetical protein CPC735_064310 [Coccidioides posadasii C735 delta SOWgp]EER28558.1 hypothetical protein CPC735_064310 [Coccidioides posadasii C735 delta SOWgp]|eukprot:XP_003070703.1 hypothetical protein CPC735_064310 [Coccidioides posadasii C735 delta SOWgp]